MKIKELKPKVEKDIIERKLVKYIYLGKRKNKVIRPKEIVRLHEDHEVYGDIALKDVLTISKESLEEFKAHDLTMLVLGKKGKGKYLFHPIERYWFSDSRKHILASAIAFSRLSEDKQNANDFMKEGLGIDLKRPMMDEELKEMYLSSTKDSLMIQDIKRLIQILEQRSRT